MLHSTSSTLSGSRSSTFSGYPLLLKLQLGLSVVLGGIDSVVGVVNEVGPDEDM